jgi:hypothetical protein
MILTMNKFAEYLRHWREKNPDIIEEEFEISYGCCLFHDSSELSNFTNIDDDEFEDYEDY